MGGVGVGHPPRARERGGDGAGPLPHRHELVDAEPRGIRPHGRVLGVAVVAELEHASEHGPAAPGDAHGGDGVEGSAHRVGVGVVGVVDDEHAVGPLGELHPPAAHGLGGRQAGGHLVERQPELERGRRDGERVADVVGTALAQGDGSAAGGRHQRVCRPAELVEGNVLSAHVCLGREPDELHPARQPVTHGRHERVVGVEHGQPFHRHRAGQLGLGRGDVGTGAELPEVRRADVEHDGDLRRRDAGEVVDVSDPPRPHLGDEEAGRRRHAADGEGHADLAVERVERRDRLGDRLEHGGEQVLGRGLARAAGDADDPQLRGPVDDAAGHGTEGGLHVGDDDLRDALDRTCGERGDGAGRHGRVDVGVAVGVLADPGHVEAARGGLAGVGRDDPVDDDVVRGVGAHDPTAREVADLGQGQRDHAAPPEPCAAPMAAPRAARTASRSSNGCFTPWIS